MKAFIMNRSCKYAFILEAKAPRRESLQEDIHPGYNQMIYLIVKIQIDGSPVGFYNVSTVYMMFACSKLHH